MIVEEQTTQYATELQPLYRLYATKIQDLISSILKSNGITPHSVTCRDKSLSSLREKIARNGKSYKRPLDEITDLAGVRIITYFPTDVNKIVPLIEKQFVIDKANSVDKRQSNDPSAFGYASVHLVVQLAADRCDLPEYSSFKNLKCEIQVRTILQHAWAEIEHDIVYKSSAEIPSELRRKFASLAGLLEVADREFELLRREESQIREKIKRRITHDNLDVSINLDSLRFYLEKYHTEIVGGDEKSRKTLGKLVQLLDGLGVKTLSELHEILSRRALDAADSELSGLEFPCGSPGSCVPRVFVAVGRQAGMSLDEIGSAMECPVLRGEVRPRGEHELQTKGGRLIRRVPPSPTANAAGRPGAPEKFPS